MRTWKERPFVLGPTAPQGQANARGSHYLFESAQNLAGTHCHFHCPMLGIKRSAPSVYSGASLGAGCRPRWLQKSVCVPLHHERWRRANHQSTASPVPASQPGSSHLLLPDPGCAFSTCSLPRGTSGFPLGLAKGRPGRGLCSLGSPSPGSPPGSRSSLDPGNCPSI